MLPEIHEIFCTLKIDNGKCNFFSQQLSLTSGMCTVLQQNLRQTFSYWLKLVCENTSGSAPYPSNASASTEGCVYLT